MPNPKKSETAISRICGGYLTDNGIPNWRCSVLTGQFRKSPKHKWYHIITGTAGLSDRQFLLDNGSGQTVYLEMKKPDGVQSDDQIAFESECVSRGVPYYIAKDLYDVQEILEIYDMVKITVKEWLATAKK